MLDTIGEHSLLRQGAGDMIPVADQHDDIARSLGDILRTEGRPDDNWRTAAGNDLDLIAASRGLERASYETDDALRVRIAGSYQK